MINTVKTVCISLVIAMGSLSAYPQQSVDARPVVGVAEFSCQEDSPYTGLVTEKVVEMLTNSRRFRVVDRTSIDKIQSELELQKSEAFLDSKNRVEQDIAVAAEKMITGHIVKIPVYRIKNPDGSVRGFKASVGFEMKVVDVATGLSSEATSFQGKASQECMSPEAAVNTAMQSIQYEIEDWFRTNFPITCSVCRIMDNKTILVNAGSEQGVKPGNIFIVEAVEMLDGQPYHKALGEIKIKTVAGPKFSECEVPKKTMEQLRLYFDNAIKIICELKQPKK